MLKELLIIYLVMKIWKKVSTRKLKINYFLEVNPAPLNNEMEVEDSKNPIYQLHGN